MLDYAIMLLIILFLIFDILYKAKIVPVNEHFFDKNNTQAMRGFWCMVIILVHVPTMYQNRIQDMIGSFAYIGVTFFFMTSAYGLTLSQDRNPEGIKQFWRKRLPKILIVPALVMLVFIVINYLIFHDLLCIFGVFNSCLWAIWLLGCYLAFWLSNMVFRKTKTLWKVLTCVLVATGSLVMYFLQKKGIVTVTTWAPECFGFIWGILLASIKMQFVENVKNRWILKWSFVAVIAAIIGITYLKFKHVQFTGDYELKIILGLAILLFTLVANVRIRLGNSINMFLGEISFEIYLIHSEMFIILSRMHRWSSSGKIILVDIGVSVFVAFVVHAISEKLIEIVKNFLQDRM